MTIYIVSGIHRSGTSMMMGALVCGGMDPFTEKSLDHITNKILGDVCYQPNSEYWEYNWRSLAYDARGQRIVTGGIGDFIKTNLSGKLVKLLGYTVLSLPEHKWKVIMMDRDEEEIRQSTNALLELSEMRFPWSAERIRRELDTWYNEIAARSDMDVIRVSYEDTVYNPVETFRKIRDAGWPINVEAAASYPNVAYYRFRKSCLMVGL